MCGICGFAGSGSWSDLIRMTTALAHRGPDAEGYWHDAERSMYLGHRRLSILDHAGGGQPMVSRDGDLIVTYNGEIYNFAALRAELTARGYQFVSDHSDTEVLLHGFREWGADLPNHLNGMWAFVLYDRVNRRLFGSRDRFGKKPLFYTEQGGSLVFASELSSLRLHPAVKTEISRAALKKYFGYGYIPAPHSILAHVHKLPGGHSFWYDLEARSLRVEKYWDFVLEPFSGAEIPAQPEQVWGEELRARLDAAVQCRLVADVPVGVFLSGGIDSSAVTALAARHVAAGKLKTFSIGFEEVSFDESSHARRVAELFHTEHHLEILSINRAYSILPAIAARLDEPMGDSSLLPCYLLAEFARKHVTVALGGDAGDELFAGYDPFLALRRAELYNRMVPRPVHQAVRMLAARLPVSHRNMSLDFKLKRTLRGLSQPPRLWLPTWMAPLGADEISELFHEPTSPEEIFSEAIAAWERCAQPNVVDRTLQFYTQLYLQDDILVKVDRATMLHGLEARAPFLDIDLVNFVRRIPAEWKFRQGQTKYLLKKALAGVLPDDVIHREKKGFGVPIGPWFHDGRMTLGSLKPLGLDDAVARHKLEQHRAGRSDERAFLWNAWLLEQWAAASPA